MKLDPYKYNRIKLRARYKYEDRYTVQDYPGTLMPVSVNRRYRPHKHTWSLPPGFLDKVVYQPRTVVGHYIRVRTQALSNDKKAGIRKCLRDMVREDMFLHMGVPCYYTERGITPIPRGVYYYHENVLYMVPVHLLPNGKRTLCPYRKYPYLDRYVDALHIHQPIGAAPIQQTMRAIFEVHTGESLTELEALEYLVPIPNPPILNHMYKWVGGHYSHIPITWWASELEVIPQVGWYVRPPTGGKNCTEGTPWGLNVMVIRIRLWDDHLEITCRVVYEEG